MEKEKLYDQIEQYLEGSLQGAEAKAFEESLQTDAELAAEVELHRKLQRELGDRQKMDLRLKLQQLSDNYQEEKSEAKVRRLGTRYNLLLIAAGVALAIGLLYWLLDSGDPTNPSNDSILTEEQNQQPEEVPQEIQVPEDQGIAQDEPQDNEPEEIVPDNVPEAPQLANNFDPNPTLESLLGNADKSKDFEFDLNVQDQKTSEGQTRFSLDGLAEAAGFEAGEKLQLAFFNNDENAYKNGQSILETDLGVKESDEEPIEAFGKQYQIYDLEYDSALNLQPGIYYYIIRKEGSNEPLYVGKIVVEE